MLSPPLAEVAAALGVLVFAFLLAVVSAAEQAFLSLTEAQVRRVRERGDSGVDLVLEYIRNPHQVIVTTILASGVFSAGSILCFLLLLSRAGSVAPEIVLGGGLIAGLALALFGRAVPRAIVSAHPEESALRVVGLYSFVASVFRPLSWMARQLLARVSSDAEGDLVAAEEFKAVAEEDDETPRLQDEKRELIHSIFEFGGTTSKEVMVPRIDMIMADAGTPVVDVLALIEQHGHSRIPIYDGSVDSILGFVHVKQLIRPGVLEKRDAEAREFIRPVLFVPETKKIDELLHEFQDQKIHLAIVVDEYGGTSGMATMEDVLEEIVGEIEDEYDHAETLLENLPDGSWRVAGKIDIDDLNEEMNLQLPTDNSDTLGGFIYELVGKVPSPGEAVEYQNLRFVIDRVHKQRIVRVRIHRTEQVRA